MRNKLVLLVACAWCTGGAAHAASFGHAGGMWPNSWPKELEPLRKQSWTWRHGLVERTSYEITFTNREQFESAWPYLLRVKSEGVSITLLRGPHVRVKPRRNSGIRIFPPLTGYTEGPWSVTRIELVIDGEIVDLNRIRLPANTPIIDKRFENGNSSTTDTRK